MTARPIRSLVLLALALLPLSVARAQDSAAPVSPAPAVERTTSTPAELKKRATYSATEFEMTVHPPISLTDGLIVEGLRYPSPLETEYRERNDVVKGKLFRLEKGAKNAAVIALGGWKFDPLTPALGQKLALTGIQVMWIEAPFQGQRTPKGRRPGDLTLSHDLVQNEDTFVQLAQDVQRAIDWLVRERGVDRDRIGLLGTSLGGFASALLYGVDTRMNAAVVQLAGNDVAAVLFNGNWLTRGIEKRLRENGIDEKDARRQMRAINPGTWADAKRGDGLLIVAAELDEIVPLATSKELAKLYGGARTIVMPGAPHRAANGLQEAFPEVQKHFVARLLASDEERDAPNSED